MTAKIGDYTLRTLPWMLKLCFITSLASILLGSTVVHFTGRFIPVYYLFYAFVMIISIEGLFKFTKANLLYFPPAVMWLFVYLVVITGSTTYLYSNITNIFVYCKDNMTPFLLLLYCFSRIDCNYRICCFLKMIIYGGIFAGGYIVFEASSKMLNLFPAFNQAIYNYASMGGRSNVISYLDPDKISQFMTATGVIRPRGLDISFTASAFFLASSLIIHLVCGRRLIKGHFINILIVVLLYASVLVSTSRQVILSLHFILLILFMLALKNKSLKGSLGHSLRRKLIAVGFACLILAMVAGFLYTIPYQTLSFLLGRTGGASSVIARDLLALPSKLSICFCDFPLTAFCGIGAYTAAYPGIYHDLPEIGELHLLVGTFYNLGLIGSIIYWSIFFQAAFKCWRAFTRTSLRDSYQTTCLQDVYLTGFLLCLLYIGNLAHYSPTGLSTNFIIGLILLISILADRNIKENSSAGTGKVLS